MMLPLFILALTPEQDRAFMEQLYTDYGRLMYYTAQHILSDYALSEDVVNDSLLLLIKKIDLLRTFSCNILKAYVVSTVRNTALTQTRRRSRTRAHTADIPLEIVSDDTQVDDRLLRNERIAEAREALGRLPEREKSVLEMKYFLRLSDAEIADKMGFSESSVRPALHRARQHLMRIFGEAGNE